ncbi:hypothetical protein F5887DRAFT_1228235 [Amanita rubescens]|nr:hypothetical protein F5887DRAFT_1228235 [Amanita rubescens]
MITEQCRVALMRRAAYMLHDETLSSALNMLDLTPARENVMGVVAKACGDRKFLLHHRLNSSNKKTFDGMDWTLADLAAFNIIVQDQDQDVFFDGPLPDYSGFPGFLEKEGIITPKEFRFQLDKGLKRARECNDIPYMVEGAWNNFLRNLLHFMKYEHLHPTHTTLTTDHPVRLTMRRNESAVTTANVEVHRHAPFRKTLLILQHDKSIFRRSNREAHLVATAIGAFQQNNSIKAWQAKQQGTKLDSSELEEQTILGITMAEQFIPTFYKIKVTAELDRAVRLGEKPAIQTIVYCHKARVPNPCEDIMTLENRRRIALYLEGFRKLLEAQLSD